MAFEVAEPVITALDYNLDTQVKWCREYFDGR